MSGERVVQGRKIAKSAHVGRSRAPHLHFHVSDDALTVTLPFSFTGVSGHAGVPRTAFNKCHVNPYREKRVWAYDEMHLTAGSSHTRDGGESVNIPRSHWRIILQQFDRAKVPDSEIQSART